MIEFIKKNKKIIVSSSIFSVINSNIYCGSCCSKISGKGNEKTENDINNQTQNEDNNDPQNNQNQPTQDQQNPPTQNPPQSNDIEQLYQIFCNLYEFCKKNENKYIDNTPYNLDSIKNCADNLKKDNNIDGLKTKITLIEEIKKNIEGNIAKEKEKEKDKEKDQDQDNEEINEIESIYDKIHKADIDENYDLTGININFINTNNFVFKSTQYNYKGGNKLDDEGFTILKDLIKHFLAKKKLKGNFTIDYIESEHVGVNPILKIKITNDNSKITFCAFIKYEHGSFSEDMLYMFKLFNIVDLLPFEYYIDLKNNLIISEDIVEKGYEFLDNKYNPTSEKNKKMWQDCTNMNEFRFWCYILNCDDIDPMYKYDNCCFKANKVYALDLRRNTTIYKEEFLEEDILKDKNYSDFLKYRLKKVNSNDISEDVKTTEQYKIWEKSINNFNDFTEDEKKNINDKLIKLISFIIGIFKNEKIKFKIIDEHYKYLKEVISHIMNFLQFYICKYKTKYTKFEYNGETLENEYNCVRWNMAGYSYGKANGIFKKLLAENQLDFGYFLTSDTLVKLYDIYYHLPLDYKPGNIYLSE